MKNKMLIFITSLVIFAAAFYLNVASSYAAGVCFSTPYTFIDHNGGSYTFYTCSSKSDLNSSFNSALAFARWGYVVTKDTCYLVLVNNDTQQITSYTNDRGKQFSVPSYYPSDDSIFYSDIRSASAALVTYEPVPPTSYDSTIGYDLEAWTVLDFDANFLTNSILNCGCFFRSNDADHVDIFVSGANKTDTFSVFGNYGAQWISMTDYADPGDTVTICFTPYDIDGNWGNTLVISQPVYTSIVQDLYQFFTGYTKKVTNELDIIGISDPTVITVEPKPTTVPPPITNPIKSTPLYVPVFQGGNGDDVINNYLVNNYTIYNDYSTVNNTINITTNIKIDYTNPGIDDIEVDIKGYSDLWVNFLNLFDSFFPFLGGVGSLAVKLFIVIFGVIVAYVPLKILSNFIRR